MKKKPAPRTKPDLLERTRAAVCLLNSRGGSTPGGEMAAFLDLFHPDMPKQQRLDMIREAAEKDRRRLR